MIVKTIVIVVVSAGVSIAAILSVLFVMDAYQQILLGEEYQKTKLAIEPSLEEATSEVEFSNPLQTYEVDSTCKLAFMIQNRIGYGESPFKMDVKFLTAMEEFRQKTIDHIMDNNSIHPKLRHYVENSSLLGVEYKSQSDKVEDLDMIYLIQPESYQEDLECGKQFHERFGDETFQALRTMFGNEELAMKRYNEIKEIISDVEVTNPEGVYDPEGRMLTEEECTDLGMQGDELKKEIDEHALKVNLLKQEYYSNPDLIDLKEEIDELSNDPHFVRIAIDHDEFQRQWDVGCAPFERFLD